MRTLAREFPVVLFAGLTALVSSLALSSLSQDSLLGSAPVVVALRAFGLGYIAAGFVLWADLCRETTGKAELSDLLGLLTVTGCVALLISVLLPLSGISPLLNWAGLGLTGAGLVIALVAMIADPAYPSHFATVWPDGGEAHPDPHIPALDLRRPDHLSVEAQDLTVIEGIGPTIQAVLNQAGIITFADVAHRSPEELEKIVRAAHLRAPVNPAKWTEQAQRLEVQEKSSGQIRMAI